MTRTVLDPREFRVAGVVSLKPHGPYAKRLDELGFKTASLELRGRPSFKHVRDLARIIESYQQAYRDVLIFH